jgi:mevalonyl-CoA ligase
VVRLAAGDVTPEGVTSWDKFLGSREEASSGHNRLMQYWARAEPGDTLCVQFTSGTTGPRKAAMLSHRQERLRFPPCSADE